MDKSKWIDIFKVFQFSWSSQSLNYGITSPKSCQLKYIQHSAMISKYMINYSKLPLINEEELEEKFVKGSGPGGQCVNKSSNACFIKHIPTGIIVKCHESRSVEQNRRRARELLISKLDCLYNGEESVSAQIQRQLKEQSLRSLQKAKKKQLRKKEWKEAEGFD